MKKAKVKIGGATNKIGKVVSEDAEDIILVELDNGIWTYNRQHLEEVPE